MTSRKARQFHDHSINQTINQNANQHERITNLSLSKNSHTNNDILNHLNSISNSSKNIKNDGLHVSNSSLTNNLSSRKNEFGYSHSYNNSSHKNLKDSLNHKSSNNNTNNNNVHNNSMDLNNLFAPAQQHRTSTNSINVKNNVNNSISNETISFRTPIPKNPKWKTSISNFINATTNTNNVNNNSTESKIVSKVQGLPNSKRAQLLAKFKKQVFFFVSKTSDPNIIRLHKKVISLGATVETFFSAKVTHKIVEDSRELTQRLINEEKREYLYPKPKENVNDSKKSQNIVNCKEWTISYLIRRINQIITDPGSTQQRLSLTQRLQQEKVMGSGLNTNREIHLLRQYYLVVEDALSLHRPIAVREYPIPKPEEKNLPPLWPQLYLVENPNGRSPFNPPHPKDYLRHQQKANNKNEINNNSNKKLNNNLNKTNNEYNNNNSPNNNNTNNNNSNNDNAAVNQNNNDNQINNIQDSKQQASGLIDKQQDSHSHIRHVHVGNSIASGIVSFSIISKRDAGEIVVPISQYAKEKDWKRKEISISDKKIENKKIRPSQQKVPTRSGDKSNIRPPAFMNKPGYCENCSMKFTNFGEHIKSMVHRSFAQNKSNFTNLDQLINEIKEAQKEDENEETDSSSDSSDYDYIPPNEEKNQEEETTTTDLDNSTLHTLEEEMESDINSDSETESEDSTDVNDNTKEETETTDLSYTIEEDEENEDYDDSEEEKENKTTEKGRIPQSEIEKVNEEDEREKTLRDQKEISNEEFNSNSYDNKNQKPNVKKENIESDTSEENKDNDKNENSTETLDLNMNMFNHGQSSPSKCKTNKATLKLIKDILMENELNKISEENGSSLKKLYAHSLKIHENISEFKEKEINVHNNNSVNNKNIEDDNYDHQSNDQQENNNIDTNNNNNNLIITLIIAIITMTIITVIITIIITLILITRKLLL